MRFCEVAVQKCQSLSRISLTTTCDPDKYNQMARLDELKKSLASRLVTLEVTFSDTLHDRQIMYVLIFLCAMQHFLNLMKNFVIFF